MTTLKNTPLFFSEQTDSLRRRMSEASDRKISHDNKWLIKGDVSGIQDFIFSVKSDKAANSLKGRSFFIEALGHLGIKLLENELGKDNLSVFYNGGGNFYVFSKVNVEEGIKNTQTKIDQTCKVEEHYLSLSFVAVDVEKQDFASIWQSINQEASKQKLRKFSFSQHSFAPYAYLNQDNTPKFAYDFVELTKALRKGYRHYHFDNGQNQGAKGTKITQFNHSLEVKTGDASDQNLVVGLPLWTDDLLQKHKLEIDNQVARDKKKETRKLKNGQIDDAYIEPKLGRLIEFSWLAHFANKRTGTPKLGILKLDVDNLGSLFEGIADWKTAQKASAGFSWFFGEYMNAMLKQPFGDGTFGDNLYVVFSGGDDTFIVGAWDAVFEFTLSLHQNFTAFAKLMAEEVLQKSITLSAGLILVDEKFPVISFAHLAEEALKEAKKKFDTVPTEPTKNAISVFGEVLSWDDFKKAKGLAVMFEKLIRQENSSRSVLERVQKTAREFEGLSKNASGQLKVAGPRVHKLFYTMRKWKGFEDVEQAVKNFSTDLLNDFISGNNKNGYKSHKKYPVAARWAEFLTRNTAETIHAQAGEREPKAVRSTERSEPR